MKDEPKEIEVYLIDGFFYQPTEQICHAMGILGADSLGTRGFHGVISLRFGHWGGMMKDRWGDSDLMEITLEPGKSFDFTKKYRSRRTDKIKFELEWKAEGGWWEGEWKMYEEEGLVDQGFARLYLIPTTAEFFAIPGVLEVVPQKE